MRLDMSLNFAHRLARALPRFCWVARLKALAIKAGFVLHEGNKEQRASDGVWTYVLRCESYNKKANRCRFSFKLVSSPVEVGSDPDELAMEAGVDL